MRTFVRHNTDPYPNPSRCQACPSGQSSQLGLGTICANCLAGQYAAGGNAHCLNCPAGKISKSDVARVCTACPTGKYAPGAGSAECVVCSPTSYNPNTSSTTCATCPQSSIVVPQKQVAGGTNISDCFCSEGQYLSPDFMCKPCPLGGRCPGGFNVKPVAGYWTATEGSLVPYKCPSKSACRGGAYEPNSTCKVPQP